MIDFFVRRLRTFGLAAALAILTACGGGDDTATPAAQVASTVAAPAAAVFSGDNGFVGSASSAPAASQFSVGFVTVANLPGAFVVLPDLTITNTSSVRKLTVVPNERGVELASFVVDNVQNTDKWGVSEMLLNMPMVDMFQNFRIVDSSDRTVAGITVGPDWNETGSPKAVSMRFWSSYALSRSQKYRILADVAHWALPATSTSIAFDTKAGVGGIAMVRVGASVSGSIYGPTIEIAQPETVAQFAPAEVSSTSIGYAEGVETGRQMVYQLDFKCPARQLSGCFIDRASVNYYGLTGLPVDETGTPYWVIQRWIAPGETLSVGVALSAVGGVASMQVRDVITWINGRLLNPLPAADNVCGSILSWNCKG